MDDGKIEIMTIDESKDYLVSIIGIDYKKYIETRLAGDFACEVAERVKYSNAELSSAQAEIEKLRFDMQAILGLTSFVESLTREDLIELVSDIKSVAINWEEKENE